MLLCLQEFSKPEDVISDIFLRQEIGLREVSFAGRVKPIFSVADRDGSCDLEVVIIVFRVR